MMKLVLVMGLFLETIISLLKVFRYRSFLHKIPIRDTMNTDIFILGNGPSLKYNLEKDLDVLQNNKTFCVNSFCLTEYFVSIRPSYYIFLDPAYFTKKNTSSKFLKLQENILVTLATKVSWSMTLFIPKKTDMHDVWYKLTKTNKNIKIVFFNNNSASGFKKVKFFLFRKNLAMPEPQNVLVGAIFLSLNMNYKNIYLLGADHSWIKDIRVNDKNQLFILNKHFTGEEEKLYYKGNESKDLWKMYEVLSALSKTFKAYSILEEYSKYLDKTICNLTKNSYIDAFKKSTIKDILK